MQDSVSMLSMLLKPNEEIYFPNDFLRKTQNILSFWYCDINELIVVRAVVRITMCASMDVTWEELQVSTVSDIMVTDVDTIVALFLMRLSPVNNLEHEVGHVYHHVIIIYLHFQMW